MTDDEKVQKIVNDMTDVLAGGFNAKADTGPLGELAGLRAGLGKAQSDATHDTIFGLIEALKTKGVLTTEEFEAGRQVAREARLLEQRKVLEMILGKIKNPEVIDLLRKFVGE